MDFSVALESVKKGRRISRSGWNGEGMHVYLVLGDGQNELPYLEMRTAQGGRVPWTVSQTDLLADDWSVL